MAMPFYYHAIVPCSSPFTRHIIFLLGDRSVVHGAILVDISQIVTRNLIIQSFLLRFLVPFSLHSFAFLICPFPLIHPSWMLPVYLVGASRAHISGEFRF
jgi:hypothetical protein